MDPTHIFVLVKITQRLAALLPEVIRPKFHTIDAIQGSVQLRSFLVSFVEVILRRVKFQEPIEEN